MEIHRSARKHGVGDADIVRAASDFVIAFAVNDDEPRREMRLGFDTQGRLLEVVVLEGDGGRELVIHCMKARRQYTDMLG